MLNNLSYRIYYVWKRNLVSYQRFAIPTFIASLGEPLLYLLAMGVGLGSYMGLINGMPYLNFLAPGLLVSTAMFAATYECTFGAMVRMTMEKVYNALIVTPLTVEEIVAGEILWGMTRCVFSGLIMLAVLSFFGIASWHTFLLMPLLWLVVGFLFSSIAIIVTAFAPNFDFFTYYLELFITPMFFFSGIFFPLDKMPDVVKFIANFLPLTHAVAISRAFVSGPITPGIIINFLVLLIPGCGFFIWALYQMKKRLIK
ncbi:MAG: ABC transporter permease [Candidatus Margulisbacteria bacterium]|nr:ABC transporter permease [Candidatus Margulisiibacteriota bacterium]